MFRFLAFLRSHGLIATIYRSGEAIRRFRYFGQMILFECALPIDRLEQSSNIAFERTSEIDFPKREYEQVFGVRFPVVKDHQIVERFSVGSELWLARLAGELIGFGWTIRGRTLKRHFFPLRDDEVHLYDFFVSPRFRGRGVNVALLHEILSRLGEDNIRRVHLECAAWNTAQLQSLRKTELRPYASASKITLLGILMVFWRQGENCKNSNP